MQVQNNCYQSIIKKDIYNNLLFVLEKCLKDNEIKMFLNKANSIGWNKSKICGHFCIFEDKLLLHEIWNRIKDHLTLIIPINNNNNMFNTNWKLIGLCEKIRLFKYEPGEYINEHSDKIIKRNILNTNGVKYNQQSFFSIYIYLNDDFSGGEYLYWKNTKDKNNINNKYDFIISPKKGDCVIQSQYLLHKNLQTFDNTKYILRLDIIYQKQELIITNANNIKPYIENWT